MSKSEKLLFKLSPENFRKHDGFLLCFFVFFVLIIGSKHDTHENDYKKTPNTIDKILLSKINSKENDFLMICNEYEIDTLS